MNGLQIPNYMHKSRAIFCLFKKMFNKMNSNRFKVSVGSKRSD